MIWPFLADSIAMGLVDSAIEDIDLAMGTYVRLNLSALKESVRWAI